MNNSTEQPYYFLTTDEILAQMQQWEERADTIYDELVARVHGTHTTAFRNLPHDELLVESEVAQQEWQNLQDVIVERAHERDLLLVVLEKLKATLSSITLHNEISNMADASTKQASVSTPPSHKTEPLPVQLVPILTNADFEHITPEVMQDFLTQKIEWLRTRSTDRCIATIEDVFASDQIHEQELLNFLLFSERKATERIACDA